MKTITSRIVLVASILLSSAAFAQTTVSPDAGLWGGGASNPSGDSAVPIFEYDPATGNMWLNTLGLNGASDTTDLTSIGGDDVGLISASIEGPCANSTAAEMTGFQNGVLWNSECFNGKQQIFGIGSGAEFLTPGEIVGWTYDAGLTAADFGVVEVAVNFMSGQPGGTIFGGVQIAVPEPSALAIAIPALLGLVALRRRRS